MRVATRSETSRDWMPLKLPTLRALGLGRVAAIGGAVPVDAPAAAVGRMAEASPAKIP